MGRPTLSHYPKQVIDSEQVIYITNKDYCYIELKPIKSTVCIKDN